MSEVTEKPAEIVTDKSEDKLEIEKEEQETSEEKVEGVNLESKEEAKKEEKNESEEKGESSTSDKEEKSVEDTEKKDSEKSDDKEKKFSLPKIKTPKIIKEIRSRSKSREKKKKKEKDDDNEEAPEKDSDEEKNDKKSEDGDKKEETVEKEEVKDETEKKDEEKDEEKEKPENSKEKETEGKSEDGEKKDVVKEAKSKVKDALDSIHLPKMPKMHKPGFMKKKTKENGEKNKDDDEGKDEKKEEVKDEKQPSEDSTEKTEKPEDKEEKNEKEGEKEEKSESVNKDEKWDENEKEKKEESEKSEECVEEKKPSIIDSLKNIKAPKIPKIFSKTKKGDNDLESGKCDESEQLLEEKDQPDGDEKEGENAPKEKQKGSSIIKSIRNVASGVPALFKKDSPKETDVESGEKDDLLEKKEDVIENKDGLKMEEIKLDDDEKKDELDNKSQVSEKKDPEKGGEVMEEKSKMDRLKRLPSDAFRQVSSLDKQKIYGIFGVLVGLLLLILVIIIAALAPRGWKNYHKLVEGGKYIETETGCGKVWGWVEGDDRFLFRAIPYSVDVERFSNSRLPETLDECGDELKHPSNESRVCMRRTISGVVGEEDCLTLDIATSSVVYDNPAPVVVYIAGDNDKLVPSSELAYNHGVVFVTVSVRQGVLGYLSHSLVSDSEKPPTSGNYALGDLLTALKWIQLNIRHFGGNPEMVTLLGHQQGASLVTALTAVEEGHGLYKKIWATGGAGNIKSLSLEEANDQFNDLVESVCKDGDRDCLLEVDAEELVGKVEEDAESWSRDNLPSSGEGAMMHWFTTDTRLLSSSLSELWSSSPVPVPIVFGVAAQAEANSANYQLYDWNNTDQVDSIVESNLGSFDVSLSAGALDLYNSSNNWLEYISMVSDIRIVCPLKQFASNFKQNYSASQVSFYIAQQANPSEENESGSVADSSTDISAIFGLFEDQKFGENLQRKFFSFVKGHISKLSADVTVFDKEIEKDNDERCSFWTKTSEEIVQRFGKSF